MKLAPARRRFVKTHRISRNADKRFRSQTDGRTLSSRTVFAALCGLHSSIDLKNRWIQTGFSIAFQMIDLVARWALNVYALRQFVVSNGSKMCDYIDGSFKTGQGLMSLSHGPAYR
jgi:hypothetical protein